MAFAVLLMTQLTKDTPVPVVWLWMFIAGLGVGTTFSVPTIVIQNAVPFKELGVATSNLTFFRQIGGTIALAFVGTIFGTSFPSTAAAVPAAGVPPNVLQDFGAAARVGKIDANVLTGVGDVGGRSSAIVRRRSAIAQVLAAIHGAFSLATASDVLARRLRRDRGDPRGRRDQGDPAPHDQRRPRSRRPKPAAAAGTKPVTSVE